MTNAQLIKLLDDIQAAHPVLTQDHRTNLAAIARGYRVMLKHGGVNGTPAVMSDEWLCGNDAFAQACNAVRAVVGEAETSITKSIRALENSLVSA